MQNASVYVCDNLLRAHNLSSRKRTRCGCTRDLILRRYLNIFQLFQPNSIYFVCFFFFVPQRNINLAHHHT